MKALCKQTMGFILMILLACGVTSIKAQDSADDEFITVSGVVKDKQTRKKLEYVNISIPGTNVGTITNNDGEFSIKVKNGLHARQVEHIRMYGITRTEHEYAQRSHYPGRRSSIYRRGSD